MKLRIVIVFCLFLSLARSQEMKLLSGAERIAAVERIGSLLMDNYVFPDVAKQCVDHLKSQAAKGVFDSFSTYDSFAQALTKELQLISHDKHMRVRSNPRAMGAASNNPLLDALVMKQQVAARNHGVAKAEILDGNVGLLDIRFFPQTEPARPTVDAALKVLENVDALIVDLRKNGGGNPDLIRYYCSHFFPPKTHLNSLYWRREDRTEEFWTLESLDGKRRPEVPVFILTSNRTFSGGEEFAYNFQTQKRASLIGETTGGGANPGGGFPVNENMGIFIPTGRAINPITKTNWEGIGVVPEIKTEAEDALEKALPLAREAAQKYSEEIKKKFETSVERVSAAITLAEVMMSEGKTKAGAEVLHEVLASGIRSGIAEETSINLLGYSYLGEEKADMAIAIFTFNVKQFPKSSNVYDSLGEGLMKAGRTREAISNYRKSLELDPRNENAKRMIEQMNKR